MKTNKLVMMIGLPANGKTTFIDTFLMSTYSSICSSDDKIEAYAKSVGKTYNEVFKERADIASKEFFEDILWSVDNKRDMIIDRTNLNKKVRNKILVKIPAFYEKIAIVLICKDEEKWKQRLVSRPGKSIPDNVIESMRNSFEFPTLEEFDLIYEVYT